MLTTSETQPTTLVAMTDPNYKNWHIPRPSLVIGRVGDKESSDEYSVHNWVQHHHYNNLNSNSGNNTPAKNSSSSQKSTVSAHSIASSGTLLLTAANLAAIHPPTIVPQKSLDTVSVASSTHFTVVNGLGRSAVMYKKSWCARHQLTVLVCTMSFLFMVGLLAGVLYMEMRVRDKYD
ncbi:uncharacterized protein LOC103572380 [Microplitis demolitor]|uniref:uncharacterized protein LOC103572380 n=1 Tax=Microplitis demolitor TaxID=69319 RepID=UPI0004CCA88E|nr:uncharacterized protein LOC103572380 [Microplitis demolitor]